FRETVARYAMDVDLETAGALVVATEPHQVAWLRDDEGFLAAETTRELINSPDFLAGARDYDGTMLVNPAKLAWASARVGSRLGAHPYEDTRASELVDGTGQRKALTAYGQSVAGQIALASNVSPSLLNRHVLCTLPISGYAVMTEP